jgi:hypothetical protein
VILGYDLDEPLDRGVNEAELVCWNPVLDVGAVADLVGLIVSQEVGGYGEASDESQVGMAGVG